MKYTPDYSCRFRILKGGKISLVVSALLVGSSIVITNGNAATFSIDNNTSQQYISLGDPTNTINVTGDLNVSGDIALFISTNNLQADVDNSGIITSDTGPGIRVYGDLNGTITNNSAKTISVSTTNNNYATSIQFDHDMTSDGALVNHGTIEAISTATRARGVYLYGSMLAGASITNNGTISAVHSQAGGDAAVSVVQINSAMDGTITNNGTLSGSSIGGQVNGLNLSGGMGGTITNNGTISTTSTTSIATGLLIGTGGMQGSASIVNSGLIDSNATSAGGQARGMRVDGMSVGSSITNATDGEIKATSTTGIARGMDLLTDMRGTVSNSGTITVRTGTGAGYGIEVERLHGTITNQSGSMIDLNGSGTQKGIYIRSMESDTNGTITNHGTISVNTNGVSSSSYGIFASSATNNTDANGTIINHGTITATKLGVADRKAYSIQSYRAGVINYGTLSGNLYIKDDNNLPGNAPGSLVNHGTIDLPHNADYAYVQDFTNKATGTLKIGLLTDGTTTTHSQLYTDNATFENGSTISVNVLAASTNAELLVGSTLSDVVYAYNSLTINGTLSITDNSALLDFEYETSGGWTNGADGTISLNAVEGTTILDSTIAGGGNTNATSSATALKAIKDAGIPASMTSFFTALNALGTDAEVARAVESTTPAGVGAVSTANSQIMNGIQGIVEMRQNNVLGGISGANGGDMGFTDKNLWAKIYGSRGTQEDKNGVRGFDVQAYGLGIGADAEIAPRTRMGGALFYTQANVDVNNVNQTSNAKVYTALLYGNTPIDPTTDFLYQAGYSLQATDSNRYVSGSGNASADYTAKTASLDLKVMKSYKMDSALTLRPLAEITYRHYDSPSYSENGSMGLNVEAFTSTQLIVGGGLIAEYKTGKEGKLIADLSLGYDLHHDSQAVTASFQGAPAVRFNTRGIDNGGWQYDVGLGYETANILGGEIDFMYNYQGQGSSFDNHVLSAKYVYQF